MGVAHSEQNLAAGRFVAPQLGHVDANGVAHSMQKRAPAWFSVPQLVQINAALVSVLDGAADQPMVVAGPAWVACSDVRIAEAPAHGPRQRPVTCRTGRHVV